MTKPKKRAEFIGAAWQSGWEACVKALWFEGLEDAARAVALPLDETKPSEIPAPGADPGWAAYVVANILNWKPEMGFPMPKGVYDEDPKELADVPFGTEGYLYALFGKDDARTLLAKFRRLLRALGFEDGLHDERFREIRRVSENEGDLCNACKAPVGKPCRDAPDHRPDLECYR